MAVDWLPMSNCGKELTLRLAKKMRYVSTGIAVDKSLLEIPEHLGCIRLNLRFLPFTDITPQGPDGLFTSTQVDELISILEEVSTRAAA